MNRLLIVLFLISCTDKKIVEYHDNGKLMKVGKTESGMKQGPWVYYLPSGDTTYVEYYHKDSLEKKSIYSSGKLLQTEYYAKGIKNGESINYYANGRIKCKGSNINDELNGQSICYYPDGKIETKATFINGKSHDFTQYHPNGEIAVTADTFGEGIMAFYDSTGNLLRSVVFKDFQPTDTLDIVSGS